MLPIVIVPGLAGSLRIFSDVLPALWRVGPVVVMRPTEDDSVGGMAARILADAPPRFVLLGHSMGGYVALEIMRVAPERVLRLVLVNTQARTDTPEVAENRRRRIALVQNGKYAAVRAESFAPSVHPVHEGDQRLAAIARDAGEDVTADAYVRQQTAILGRIDQRPHLPKIGVPTLILTGDGDRLISNEYSREMAALIPGATLVVIPECGHLSPIEQPAAVAAAVARFLT
jgi:pimeloyl-ACP methyl ester carboxylesterase